MSKKAIKMVQDPRKKIAPLTVIETIELHRKMETSLWKLTCMQQFIMHSDLEDMASQKQYSDVRAGLSLILDEINSELAEVNQSLAAA